MSGSRWKPYPNYKSSKSPIGALPASWDEIRFRMLFETQKGKIPSEIHPKPLPDSVPYLTLEYIRKGKNPQYVVLAENLLVLNENDILIWWDGTAGEVLKSPLGVISSTAAHISPKYDECRDFDYYSLKAMEPIIKSGTTGMGIPHVDGVFLKELYLPRPELDEKKKIAQFLNHRTEIIDSVITRLKQILLILEEKLSALITQIVTKGLNNSVPMKDSGIDWIGEIPSHWSLSKVGYLSKVISKGTTPSTIGKEIVPEGVKFLKAENIHYDGSVSANPEFFIDEETDTILKRSRLISDDILIVIAGATTGKCAVLTEEFVPANTNQAVCFVRLHDTRISKFIQTWLSCELIQEQIKQDSVQSAQPNLAMEDVRNFVCPLPPIDEIELITNKIIEFTNNISNSKSEIEKQIKYFDEYRASLISAAVSGKIDVRSL